MLNLRSILGAVQRIPTAMPHSPVKDGFELSKTRRTLPMALLRAREAVMERFRPLLLAHGVTEQQWRVLRVLKEAEETDASDLADAASILAPSLSRTIRVTRVAPMAGSGASSIGVPGEGSVTLAMPPSRSLAATARRAASRSTAPRWRSWP